MSQGLPVPSPVTTPPGRPVWYQSFLRLLRFSLVGATGIVVNEGLLFILHGVLLVPLLLASAVAIESSIVSNYLLNDRWTFGHRAPSLRRFTRFNTVYLLSVAVNLGVLTWAMRVTSLHYLLANGLGIALAFGLSYALNVRWTYRATLPTGRTGSPRVPMATPLGATEPKRVIVLLPTYNERENIEGFAMEIIAAERHLPGYRLDVLIVDGGSPDGTAEIARTMAARDSRVHCLQVGRGFGVALISGHQYALAHLRPDILAQLDADGQVGPDVLPRLVHAIEAGYDLAIGSRFVKGGENRLGLSRRTFARGMSVFCRMVMGPFDVQEFSNCARAFTPDLFRRMDFSLVPWQEKTFIIQPAFLHAAIVAGARYKEVPLVFKDRPAGYSKMRITHYIYDVVTYTVEARLRRLGLPIPVFRLTHRSSSPLVPSRRPSTGASGVRLAPRARSGPGDLVA